MKTDRQRHRLTKRSCFAGGAAFLAGFLAALPFASAERGGGSGVPVVAELMQSVQLVEGGKAGLPPEGKATLRDLFGWREALALQSALGGRYATENRACRFVRNEKTTRIWLPALTGSDGDSSRGTDDSAPVWMLDIDNRSGFICRTPGLPDISSSDLLKIAAPVHRENPSVDRLKENVAFLRTHLGEQASFRETTCYDVRGLRVGDRMKYYWLGRLEGAPKPNHRTALRFVYWIDIASRTVVDCAVEVQGKTIAIP